MSTLAFKTTPEKLATLTKKLEEIKSYFQDIDNFRCLGVPYTMQEYAIELLELGVKLEELYDPLLKVGIDPRARAKALNISSLDYSVRYGLIEICLRYYTQNANG